MFYVCLSFNVADNSSWSIEVTSGVHVKGRYGHSSVYDEHSNSVFVYGGYHIGYKPGYDAITKHAYRYMVEHATW